MKKFQKIDNGLFKAIPASKMNSLAGGHRGTTYTDLFSTGSCECGDAGDLDASAILVIR